MPELRRLTFVAVTVAFCALSACDKLGGDSHSKAAGDVVTQLQVVSDAIATVTDKNSADAAGQKITQAAGEIDKVAARIKKLPQATQKENDAIHTQVQPQMTAIKQQLQQSMTRLHGNDAALSALQMPMMKLQMSLMGIGSAVTGAPPLENLAVESGRGGA